MVFVLSKFCLNMHDIQLVPSVQKAVWMLWHKKSIEKKQNVCIVDSLI